MTMIVMMIMNNDDKKKHDYVDNNDCDGDKDINNQDE